MQRTGGLFKSPHTLQIPLVFDNVERARVLLGEGDQPQKLADHMANAWIAFAKTGNPSVSDIPAWPAWPAWPASPAFDAERRATVVFNKTTRVIDDPDGNIRRLHTG